MILIYNNNVKFEVRALHSYSSSLFVADILCDENNIFPTVFSEEDILELYSKEDNMKLKTIFPSSFEDFSLTLIEDNIYSLKLSNNVNKEQENNIDDNHIEFQLQELEQDFKEKLKMGIMLPTEYGIQRFSFEGHDQQNLVNAYNYLINNPEVEKYWYHANGEQMQLFSKETILELHRIMIEFINEQLVEYHKKKAELEA